MSVSGSRMGALDRTSIGTLLIRLMVGTVFLSEGLQKFIYPASRGSGRFEAIGFPMHELLGYSVGGVEVICGLAILVGLMTRRAALLTLLIMLVALLTTKLPILLGHGWGPFGVRELSRYGFWSMAHEMRTDWAMLLGSAYLVLMGGGRYTLRYLLGRDPEDGSLLDVETDPGAESTGDRV